MKSDDIMTGINMNRCIVDLIDVEHDQKTLFRSISIATQS